MDRGQFGIMIGQGSAGIFAIEDVKVEEYLENPFPSPKPPPPQPVVEGNLIPRGSFESGTDPFWCYDPSNFDPDEVLCEPSLSRVFVPGDDASRHPPVLDGAYAAVEGHIDATDFRERERIATDAYAASVR